MEKFLEFLKWFLVYGVLLYLVVMIYVYFFSDRAIFLPPPASYQDTSEIIKLKTADGAIISAIYLKNPKAKYTFLYSHGNAIDIGGLLPFLKTLQQHNFSVFSYDYQGYGTSTGKSSEKHAYNDITAAYDYLTNTLHIPPNQIIAYGKSLGAAITIDLAIRKSVGGVILESPFISAFRTVTHWPILPFDKFNSLRKIDQISVPLLIIHGESDRTIPLWHGKKLYEMAKSSKKMSLWLPELDHNDLPYSDSEYWQAINQLVQMIETQNKSNISRSR